MDLVHHWLLYPGIVRFDGYRTEHSAALVEGISASDIVACDGPVSGATSYYRSWPGG
jgi:hypothetical protein